MQNPFAMPDDDDYGYVSKTSEALHLKLMEKYNKMPEDPKFSGQNGKTKSASNENGDYHFKNGQKQRVSKIMNEKEPTKKVPTSTSTRVSYQEKKPAAAVAAAADKPKPRPPPPAINFEELLKLAAQKQHEDIVIDVPTSKKEPERLLTLKEKKEMEELEAARKAKLMRAREMNRIPKIGSAAARNGEPSSKHDRNNNDKEKNSSFSPPKVSLDNKKKVQKVSNGSESIDRRKYEKQLDPKQKSHTQNITPAASSSSSSSKSQQDDRSNRLPSQKSNLPSRQSAVVPSSNGAKLRDALSKPTPKPSSSSGGNSSSSSKPLPSKPREFPPRDLKRPREFPPKDLMRSREFPPRDLKRLQHKQPMQKKRKACQINAFRHAKANFNFPSHTFIGRIIDDDDESDYDSELDDFIDDGEEEVDYSSEIQKIFGYNKSR
jgi:protein SPT2